MGEGWEPWRRRIEGEGPVLSGNGGFLSVDWTTVKKYGAYALIGLALAGAGYGIGRLSGDRITADGIGASLSRIAEQAGRAGESLERAGRAVDGASKSLERIQGAERDAGVSAQKSAGINEQLADGNAEFSGIIDRGERVIAEIRKGSKGNQKAD